MSYTDKVLGIQSANLIAYWPLSETSGTTADNAEGTAARDGTYSNVTLNSETFTDGTPAPSFNGTTSKLSIPTAAFNGVYSGREITVSCWIKMSGAGVWSDGANRYITSFPYVDGSNRLLVFKTTTTNQIQFFLSSGGVAKSILTTAPGGTTNWFHLAYTQTLSTDAAKVYIDGSQVGTTQTGIGTYSNGNLSATFNQIGANTAVPTDVHSGYIKHFAVWTKALSDAEVLDLATV